MKSLLSSFLIFLCLTSNAQRIYGPAVPINWTERESEEEINDGLVMQRIFPYGKADVNAYQKAVKNRMNSTVTKRATTTADWLNAGPLNIGGRITDCEMPGGSLSVIYVCSASGGIFKSLDKGLSWNPIFDAQPTLSIGDLAISKSNTNILFAGTGEPNAGGGSITYDGNGIYKSTDAGATWTHVGLDSTRNTGRIAIHPTNPDIVFAATMGDLFANNPDRGLYKSVNGGTTWQSILAPNDSTGVIDVAINPAQPDTMYACTWTRVRRIDRRNYGGPDSKIMRSFDGGQTWSQLTNGLPSGFDYGRTGIAVSASQPNIVYALIADQQSTFQGVYRSIDYGNTFTRTNDLMLGDIFSGSAHWEGRITVDPTNSDIVFIVGFDTYATLDGGQNWIDVSANLHPDNHDVFINPADPLFVLRGNDEGLFISEDGGFNWLHSENLPITQFYTCETDERFPFQLAGGTQDIGVNQTFSGLPDDYSHIWGGDGFYILIDPSTSFSIMESQYGYLSTGTFGMDSLDRFNWNTPMEFNHQNTNSIFVGASRIYKSYDQGMFWNPISPDLTNHNLFGYPITWGTITTVSNTPTDSSVIYCGTDDGQVWVTQNDGLNWTNINPSTAVRWITRVTADPRDASIVYCTVSGYKFHDNIAHVYMSNNFGSSWQSIEGNLPDVPCNDIIADPTRDSILYVATDIGVYITYDMGQSWDLFGTSMPVVPVTDLRFHQPTMTLIAATYGRSLYTMDLTAAFVGTGKEIEQSSIEIYPNPADKNFNVRFYSPSYSTGQISIKDVSGRSVYEDRLNVQSGLNAIEINQSFSQGIYIVRVQVGDKSYVGKLVIR